MVVNESEDSKGVKGFGYSSQFVAMLFCQLGQIHSLREITRGLATSMGKVKHLGIDSAPSRSTLSYANNHRPYQLYREIFYFLLGTCKEELMARRSLGLRIRCIDLVPQ